MQVLHRQRSWSVIQHGWKISQRARAKEGLHTHIIPQGSQEARLVVSRCVCVGCGWLTDRHTQTKSCAPRRCGRPGEWRRARPPRRMETIRESSPGGLLENSARLTSHARCVPTNCQRRVHDIITVQGPSLGSACEWNFPLWYLCELHGWRAESSTARWMRAYWSPDGVESPVWENAASKSRPRPFQPTARVLWMTNAGFSDSLAAPRRLWVLFNQLRTDFHASFIFYASKIKTTGLHPSHFEQSEIS